MGFVFLLVRFALGGWFAWHGAQRLDIARRAQFIAIARNGAIPLPLVAVPLSGLMLVIGGASLATGVFAPAGIALLVTLLIPAAFAMHPFWRASDAVARIEERRRFARSLTLAALTLALLAVPQPWPLTLVSY